MDPAGRRYRAQRRRRHVQPVRVFFGRRPGSATTFNAIAWPTAIVLISMAVWLRPRRRPLRAREGRRVLAARPGCCRRLSSPVRRAAFTPVSRVAIGLATATLFAVGIRLALSVRRLQAPQPGAPPPVGDRRTDRSGNRRYLFQVLDAFFADATSRRAGHSAGVPVRRPEPLQGDQRLLRASGRRSSSSRQLGAEAAPRCVSTDLLVRIGGDEFAVVLDRRGRRVCRRGGRATDRSLKSRSSRRGQCPRSVRASASPWLPPTPPTAPDCLVRRRGHVPGEARKHTFYASTSRTSTRAGPDAAARGAAGRDRAASPVLHYQPQLDLRTGEILAVEALCAGITRGSDCSHPTSSSLWPRKPD